MTQVMRADQKGPLPDDEPGSRRLRVQVPGFTARAEYHKIAGFTRSG